MAPKHCTCPFEIGFQKQKKGMRNQMESKYPNPPPGSMGWQQWKRARNLSRSLFQYIIIRKIRTKKQTQISIFVVCLSMLLKCQVSGFVSSFIIIIKILFQLCRTSNPSDSQMLSDIFFQYVSSSLFLSNIHLPKSLFSQFTYF